MTNIYLIEFIGTDLKYTYTSLDALYTAHTKDDVGVTKEHLYNVFRTRPHYKNKKVIINKLPAYNKNDVNDNLNDPVVIYR